ncbi:MAG: hypothetical protein Q9190_007806, partial [Brigantiaea leucoxantha]
MSTAQGPKTPSAKGYRIADLRSPPVLGRPHVFDFSPAHAPGKIPHNPFADRLPASPLHDKRSLKRGWEQYAERRLSGDHGVRFFMRSSPFSNEEPPKKKQCNHGLPTADKLAIDSKQHFAGHRLNPPDSWYDPKAYQTIDFLGRGSEGTAYLLERQPERQLVCCKVIPRRSTKDPVLPNELRILKDNLGHHDRIIQFHNATVTPSQTEIYMDYCDGGSLQNFINNYYYHPHHDELDLPESFVWHALSQLTEAVLYLHHGLTPDDLPTTPSLPPWNAKKGFRAGWLPIIHRDIKPANILLRLPSGLPHQSDHPGPLPFPRLILSDFGLSLASKTPHQLPTSYYLVGTPEWQPPELPFQSTKSDIWGIGAVAWALCTGRSPIMRMPEGYHQEDWPIWAEMEEARYLTGDL